MHFGAEAFFSELYYLFMKASSEDLQNLFRRFQDFTSSFITSGVWRAITRTSGIGGSGEAGANPEVALDVAEVADSYADRSHMITNDLQDEVGFGVPEEDISRCGRLPDL